MKKRLPNVHPGEVLLEEFLKPLGISQNRLARELKVPPRRVNEIILGKRAITPDTALRLARYFGTSERFWLGLQLDYDLEEAQRAIGETCRYDYSMASKLSFLLALLLSAGAAPAAELARGTVVEKVVCAGQPDQAYVLYLPSNYTPERQWPI